MASKLLHEPKAYYTGILVTIRADRFEMDGYKYGKRKKLK